MAEMKDADADLVRPGEKTDRKVTATGMAATGGAAGLVIGLMGWLMVDCYAGGHWHWVAPSQQLIGIGGPIVVLPVALWVARVFQIVGDIITRRLERIDTGN